jgi:hypothetical protein
MRHLCEVLPLLNVSDYYPSLENRTLLGSNAIGSLPFYGRKTG